MSGGVLVVGGDLMARERIRSAAAGAGVEVAFAPFTGLVAALQSEAPRLLILDLDDGREALLGDVAEAGGRGLLPGRVLGYYSHVDAGLGDAAKRAGVEPVRRGVFWQTLPALLIRPFPAPAKPGPFALCVHYFPGSRALLHSVCTISRGPGARQVDGSRDHS